MDEPAGRCTDDCGCRGEMRADDCGEEPWCDVCYAWVFGTEDDVPHETEGDVR